MPNDQTIAHRLDLVRQELTKLGWSAYIVWGTDPHESEYVAPRWQTRSWLTGFSGSAGVVAITLQGAGLWTDGRYHVQAEAELPPCVTLFKEGLPDVPTLTEWLSHLTPGSAVGVCAETTSSDRYQKLASELAEVGLRLEAGPDPLTSIWVDRPEAPQSSVWDYQAKADLDSRREKLARLRQLLAKRQATVVLSALDDIAWLFNLRASDIAYVPVLMAYALVNAEQAFLFADPKRLKDLVPTLAQDGISVRAYETIEQVLAEQTGTLWLPPQANLALTAAAGRNLPKGLQPGLLHLPSPVSALKSVKTPKELNLIREAHRKDGAALVEFLTWWENRSSGLPQNAQTESAALTEREAASKLDEFRAAQGNWLGPSFEPIPGFREHGAVIHYKVSQGNGSFLTGDGLFLLDTGAQYLEGTTDVTRTLCLGTPLSAQREDYTLVLKAHIQVSMAVFPRGTRGYMLDAAARLPLWKTGRQFYHGTGHGVGQFLSVHEGPVRLNSEPLGTALEPGMVLSNEPGIYRPGQWGIRIENLITVVAGPRTEFAEFFSWETLTLCPYERKLIDVALLTPEEKTWVDNYHQTVLSTLSPGLSPGARRWLEGSCAPL
ncbi:MAG: aminopeptidase P family protein [Spirochaetales bacterium]|nr:aminopeptidase P family protein [Spirochaetales bacterium]